jgi:peroxiredoxin Q/BCP
MRFTPSRAVQFAAVVGLAGSAVAAAQTPATQPPKPGSAAFAPDAGAMAPDFSLAGATRYGLVKTPVHLSDFRGQTVVLAFFPKARTKG